MTLDDAWKAAAKALYDQPGGSPYLSVTQDLMAWAVAEGVKYQNDGQRMTWDAEGDTPAEALEALTVKLRASPSP